MWEPAPPGLVDDDHIRNAQGVRRRDLFASYWVLSRLQGRQEGRQGVAVDISVMEKSMGRLLGDGGANYPKP